MQADGEFRFGRYYINTGHVIIHLCMDKRSGQLEFVIGGGGASGLLSVSLRPGEFTVELTFPLHNVVPMRAS